MEKTAREVGIGPGEAREEVAGMELLRKRETWRRENREAIEAFNVFVVRHGDFLAGLRRF